MVSMLRFRRPGLKKKNERNKQFQAQVSLACAIVEFPVNLHLEIILIPLHLIFIQKLLTLMFHNPDFFPFALDVLQSNFLVLDE
jgi:hypothetical protein